MADTFTQYESGLKGLLERLGRDHPCYAEALTLQARLLENTDQARQYGDTEARRAERSQIVNALNRLALKTIQVSFNELCELGRDESMLTVPVEPPDLPQPSERKQLLWCEIVTLEGTLVGGWLLKVREALADPMWQGIGGIVALLALVVAIGTWFWPDIRMLLFPATPIATPTATVTVINLTEARVRFTIRPSSDRELEISAGGTFSLWPGDVALIEVSVTVNQASFPRQLAFRYFAPRGNIPDEHGGPKASYVAPTQSGPDIITVQITDSATGDAILRSINVVVSEK